MVVKPVDEKEQHTLQHPYQLVLVQAYERAVEHELCSEQLICGVDLTGCLALEQHHACVCVCVSRPNT